MEKTKETTSQRKTRHAERLEIVRLWCKTVRKHVQLPEQLKGSLTALVDGSRPGVLTVHIYEVGPVSGRLIVQKQKDILPDLKFWMVASPSKKDDDKTPRLRLFSSIKQDVSVYSGNHYVSVKVPLKLDEQPSKKELLRLFK